MDEKGLEILLSGLEGFSHPKPQLEQWATPGPIAAKMAVLAKGDIEGRTVLDLGAGTGILSVAAALVGARRVVCVEADGSLRGAFGRNAERAGVRETLEFVESDVSAFWGAADVAIMNPPFGAQKAALHADRVFLEKAMDRCESCYSLHLARTRTFISGLAGRRNWNTRVLGTFIYPLPATFAFHKKRRKEEEVDYHKTWK